MAIQAQQLFSENLGFPMVGGSSQDWIDNACGGSNEFYFNLPQKQQIIKQQQQQQQLLNLQQSSFLLPRNNQNIQQSMAFSVEIEKQRIEIDQFISLQNERLRLALQEQRKQQLELVLRKYEANTNFLMKQKDDEIEKALQRTMELEEFLRRMEIENQTWQRLAKENEATVQSLKTQIENLKENACFVNGVEDAESCCDVMMNRGGTEYETEKNRGHEKEQEIEEQSTRNMICKSCNSRSSCVVLLPCRHLCSCKACEAFLDYCPLCGMTKKASIELESLF